MKRILFVCTGNTCRSSMAEGIFKHLLKMAKEATQDFEVISAGTAVFIQEPANEKAIRVMEERGIDISSHKSQPISKELSDRAHLILTMTASHKEQILRVDSQLKDKVYTLLEFVQDKENSGGNMDIRDPFGGSLEEYRRTANELEGALKKLVDKIGKKYFW